MSEFVLEIEQVDEYEFKVRFDKEQYAELRMDEPPPLGKDAAPSPSQVLAAAVGDCLSASLLFCMRKARVPTGGMKTRVHATVDRNERGRLRVRRIEVEIDPNIPEEAREQARRCLALFEDFCTVTQSVREGIDIQVRVAGFEAAAPPAGMD